MLKDIELSNLPLVRYVIGAALVVSAFLFTHAYSGIRHDGILYAGDALTYLVGGKLHQDLYFLYGSQGQFTILPYLYSRLIDLLGLSGGTITGLLLAFGIYLFACFYLLKKVVSAPLLFFCMVSIALGWTIYGGRRVFAYSEAFLTARSFAEPTVLMAVAFLARRKNFIAVFCIGLALFLHPLVGLTGALLIWAMLTWVDRRWLWIALAVGVVSFGIALHPFGPFADLTTQYDPKWLDLVQEANPQAFISLWSPYDGGVVIFDVAVLWLLVQCSPNPFLTRLAATAALAGVLSVMATFIAVDVLHSTFIGKLQIWRVLWISHWLATATLPIVLQFNWKEGPHGRLTATLLAIGWMAPFSVAPAPMGLSALFADRFKSRYALSSATVKLVFGVAALIGVIIAAQFEIRVFKLGDLLAEPMQVVLGKAASMNLILLFVVVAVWRYSTRSLWLAFGLSAMLLAISAATWDQRAPWTRKLESYEAGHNIWTSYIEPNSTVYWYRDLIAPWVLLGHGNYYTQQQGSGAVFSRELTVELEKRKRITAILDMQEQICRMMNGLNEAQGTCEPDAVAVHSICTEGGIDYIVLQSTLEGVVPIADFSTGVVENGYEKKFFLYRCAALKSG